MNESKYKFGDSVMVHAQDRWRPGRIGAWRYNDDTVLMVVMIGPQGTDGASFPVQTTHIRTPEEYTKHLLAS